MCPGIQSNRNRSFCSKSETVVIVVTLPISKSEFEDRQAAYILSIAETADVDPENVMVLGVNEIASRAASKAAVRLLLASFVQVKTSVIVASGQAGRQWLQNLVLLSSNLNSNGLPSGTLTEILPDVPAGLISPGNFTTGASPFNVTPTIRGSSTAQSSFPLGAVVGGILGSLGFLSMLMLLARERFKALHLKRGSMQQVYSRSVPIQRQIDKLLQN